MKKQNTPVVLAKFFASLVVALVLGLTFGCGDDDDAVVNPPGFEVPDYFWRARTPLQFSDFQGVGAATIDTVSVAITNDRSFDENDPMQNTIISFDGGEVWEYGPVVTDTLFAGLEQFGDTLYILGDENIHLSTDGLNWTQARWLAAVDSFSCACVLGDIARGSGIFVAPARRYIAYSTDGLYWQRVARPTITDDNVFFNSVTFDGSRFLVLATNFSQQVSQIFTSQDGETWDSLSILPEQELRDIAYFNQSYIVVGEGGAIYSSTDANTWQSIDLQVVSDLIFASIGNSELVIGGTDGTLLISRDMADWDTQLIPNGSRRTILGIYWDGRRYIAVGENLILVTEIPN